MKATWYLRRLSRMGPREIAGRAVAAARIRWWRGPVPSPEWLPARRFTAVLPDSAVAGISADAKTRLLASADELMAGRAEYFGVPRTDLAAPDWSFDPRTGRRAPADVYAFDVPYRDESAVGDIKQIWEPSRHQHLTVLAAAYAVTGENRYAERVAKHLRSWWAENPPLRGAHWVSGIELGIRLLSWVWVRRLLDRWPGAAELFEDNPDALHQIWHHQRWLAGLGSHGSSANNHVIAEAAGQLAAACAFDWFPESARWRADALRVLDTELGHNTFGSGINRELASEYHGLVLELGLAAAVEARFAGVEVPASTWLVLLRMTDALAATVDIRLRPARQGDADDGHGLIIDGAETDRWASLLATGDVLFGRLDWWPGVAGGDVRTALLAALGGPVEVTATRPTHRPDHFADAGLTVLRGKRVWCRCDGGPHGFLSIAAHAHADALSVEVRHDGVDILADPGTYCYHGEPRWRTYFRSTLGHNTLELGGADQSISGGPFMWTKHARSRVLVAHTPSQGTKRWSADHDGYSTRGMPVFHRRTVELDGDRELRIIDEVQAQVAKHPAPRRQNIGAGGRAATETSGLWITGAGRSPIMECVLAFHLGPSVEVALNGHTARLTWAGRQGAAVPDPSATLELAADLDWTAHRGETDPPLGWYSPGFGRKVPAWTLVGRGQVRPGAPLASTLRFEE